MSGTSMAAPMVSGFIALMYSLDPNLTIPEIKQILSSNSPSFYTDPITNGQIPILDVFSAITQISGISQIIADINGDAKVDSVDLSLLDQAMGRNDFPREDLNGDGIVDTADRSFLLGFISQVVLTVTRNGTGSGTVTSSPVGINCGVTCQAFFNSGTVVTLTASPAAGSDFTGWSGNNADCTDGQVTMTVGMICTATFNLQPLPTFTLNITKTGTGNGTVTSTDGSINCGPTCQASFNSGTIVILTATSDTGSDFSGWGGACAGTVGTTCTLTMAVDTVVMATFTTQDVNPPSAKISFPPPVSMTDAAQITVRGTATDETGVISVLVNGVAATTSDGFANWQAVVLLSPGDNTLVVATSDTLGNTNANVASASTKRQIIFNAPYGVVLDAANNLALVTDPSRSALFVVDLATGNRSILSDNTTGTGPDFIVLFGVALDVANNRVLVIESSRSALFVVDLATGNRSILSDDTTGTGTIFGFLRNVALDAANNLALVIDDGLDVLFAVDLGNGERVIISR